MAADLPGQPEFDPPRLGRHGLPVGVTWLSRRGVYRARIESVRLARRVSLGCYKTWREAWRVIRDFLRDD